MATAHPALATRSDRGCLMLADISGYTAYLQGTEIEHAQDVLADLTETVVRALAPPLHLSELEGDAAFVYALGDRIDPSMLLDAIESCYFAFRRRVDAIDRATSCECNACVLIPRLDLKFVAHYGSFGRHPIAGRERVSGTDVVLVHRLLKNEVGEAIGHRGYAFLTSALVASMGLDPVALRLSEHVEATDELGEVRGWVEDLHVRWREEQERRRVYVAPERAAITWVTDTPAPRQLLWTYLTDPVIRRGWQPDTSVVDQTNPSGRRGAGTTNHCVHGQDAILEEIVDWRPFDYFTLSLRFPMPGMGPSRITQELTDLPGGGSRLVERVERPSGMRDRLLMRVLAPIYRRKSAEASAALIAALQAALDAGETPAEPEPEPEHASAPV